MYSNTGVGKTVALWSIFIPPMNLEWSFKKLYKESMQKKSYMTLPCLKYLLFWSFTETLKYKYIKHKHGKFWFQVS